MTTLNSAESASWEKLALALPKLDITMYVSTTSGFVRQITAINYSAWKLRLRLFLQFEGLWSVVDPSNQNEKDRAGELFEARNKKAFLILALTISDTLVGSIMECNTARQAWEVLERQHGSGKSGIKDTAGFDSGKYVRLHSSGSVGGK
ncbi:hypothetical protein BJ508DRAFT_411801 [Ascobolus immersus RN42]|uniref:Uncharacterized protein n=1 Tax=Ascobolus immersus RN42 TaxID=1160509 RepID=A0A3N4II60_ASCIM|nr:hypothetical protein BJ508DRAFT_411801 [Ascobolus immersus RN42]